MDSLLPSEIARLVLGYLEDEKCEDAARSFLEMSPHLDECRTVTSSGGRFSTRVNGFTLVEILEKFCAANATIQERLSKVADCEQLKHCGDLSEQLRFLVDGSRGQRFVVNINVPTSQTSAGSPIISSSVRKRQHSGSERDRSKRAHKSHSQSWGKTSEQASGQLGCDAVETTPLEHLPGHSGSEKSEENNLKTNSEKCQKERSLDCCSSTVTESIGSQSLPENRHKRSPSLREVQNPRSHFQSPNERISPKKREIVHEKCSTGTDTEELMRFTNTEVQTTPYDVAESETDLMDEPVENLSLLTKELLNRTELQERIAENINKAILPADMSLRDASLSESFGGEINTSIMTELNNAIKSVVTATESDPIFAKFLDEIIGPHAENDTSPDEDAADHGSLDTIFSNLSPEFIPKTTTPELPPPQEKKSPPQPETPEVPLKNRLRSSASQQIVKPEEDRATARKVAEKEDTALEDLNAAAILSIINANNKLENEKRSAELVDAAKEIIGLPETVEAPSIPPTVPDIPEPATLPPIVPPENVKPSRKSNVRKPRAKPKPKPPPVIPESVISEEEIMAMPTLIVCSKEEMTAFIGVPPAVPQNPAIVSYRTSQFHPIAPKTDDIPPPIPEPLYLRTVNVATKAPNITQEPTIKITPPQPRVEQNHRTNNTEKVTLTSVLDLATGFGDTGVKAQEKITLYGNENSNISVLNDAVLPTVNVDETVSVSGTGLSPFLKFNNKPADSAKKKSTEPVDASLPIEIEPKLAEATATASTSKQETYEMLTKRTPRSLLKSRSKNHRLSLSTPRRRSSHIRALDFNTPTKAMNSSRRMSVTDNGLQFSPKTCNFVKKVCRTSLFKSPPFAGSPSTPNNKKIKSNAAARDCRSCKVPIATRSPAPKLMGGWEKYTGVGIILGSTSPSSSTSSPVKNTTTNPQQTVKKSWDADLRQSLQIAEDVPKVSKKVATKKAQSAKKRGRKKDVDETSRNSENAPAESETLEIPTAPKESTDKKLLSTEVAVDLTNSTNSNENFAVNNRKVVEKSSEEIATSLTVTNNAVKSNEIDKKIKKYAQLKTITSNVTNLEKRAAEILNNAVEKSDKIVEFAGNYSESSQRIMQLPNMLNLETPRKLENNFGIPPTPRLLSPSSSNSIMPFGLGHGEDSVKVLQNFIPTPEFPSTPCIAVTPKQISESTVEDANKEFACSNYYQPSSELKDPRLPKLHNDQSRHDMSLPLPGIIVSKIETHVSNISAQVAEGFQASTSSGKLEITQFEVIKENLPRDQTLKELNISSSTIEKKIGNEENPMEISDSSPSAVIQASADESKNTDKSCSTADDDSSDSDSSCSSDSSSDSSSSSSSSSSSATNTSANITITKPYTKKTPNKIYTDTSNENSTQKTAASVPSAAKNSILQEDNSLRKMLVASRVENESSPKKVFAIVKTDKALDECATETPVKDESLLAEANISETPSSSKAGFDNVTNLTSKITAFITTEETKRNRTTDTAKKAVVAQTTQKALPTIVSVQRILPDVSIALKPATGGDVCNAAQNRPNSGQQFNALSNAKLSRQLEEKRLRLMAKFKEKDKPPPCKTRVKRTAAVAKAKKRPETDQSVPEEITKGASEEKEVDKVVENPKNENDEETEKQTVDVKSERYKKSQMLKELFDESCSTSTPIKQERREISSPVLQASQVEKKQKDLQKKEDEKSKNRSRSLSRESSKSRASEKIIETLSSKLDENVSGELSEMSGSHSPRASLGESKTKNSKREDCTEAISMNAVESNKLPKSKVDLVKRDLFSDEESSDQRTTRSRTRQTCDLPKSESNELEISASSKVAEKDGSTERKKDLPGVLECLDLVPTVKADTTDEDLNVAEISQSHAEYHFIYDDAVPTKRRRRKFSSSELEFSVEVELTDEDYKTCSKVMTATAYEEIFNLLPPRKKRGTTKEPVKMLKHSKRDATPRSNAKTVFGDIQDKPLATSSPVVKNAAIKVPTKCAKSPAAKIQSQPTETKKKLAENEKPNPKSRKRKASASKESEQVEKKPRNVTTATNPATITANPQLLLSKVDLDKFLTTVHGPA